MKELAKNLKVLRFILGSDGHSGSENIDRATSLAADNQGTLRGSYKLLGGQKSSFKLSLFLWDFHREDI